MPDYKTAARKWISETISGLIICCICSAVLPVWVCYSDKPSKTCFRRWQNHPSWMLN